MNRLHNVLPVGIDPSREELTVVSINPEGLKVKVKNTLKGYKTIVNHVKRLSERVGKEPVFSIEGYAYTTPELAYFLAKDGFKVYHIPPFHASRMRELLSEDKTDYLDAKTCALAIVQMPQILRPVSLDIKLLALKRAVKTRLRLVKDQTRDINTLHYLLTNLWGGLYKKFFYVLNSRTALYFFSVFSTPEKLLNAPLEKIRRVLRVGSANYYTGRRGEDKIREIMEVLRDEEFCLDEYLKEVGEEVELFSRNLLYRSGKIKSLERRIRELSSGSIEVALVRTVPGFDWVLATSVVALSGDIRRFGSVNKYVAYAGLALAQYQSGGRRSWRKRKKRNKWLAMVFYQAALSSLKTSAFSQEYYKRKLREGKEKKEALRALAKKLAEIVYAILRDQRGYDGSIYE